MKTIRRMYDFDFEKKEKYRPDKKYIPKCINCDSTKMHEVSVYTGSWVKGYKCNNCSACYRSSKLEFILNPDYKELIQEYKVMYDYPDSKFKKGQILKRIINTENLYSANGNKSNPAITKEEIEKYKDIFYRVFI